MNIATLGYVGVESPSFDDWHALGPSVFNLGLAEPGRDGTCFLRMDDRHHRIAIHPGPRNRLSYIGWEVPTLDDLDNAARDLTSWGTAISWASDGQLDDRKVEQMLRVQAPSGICHEIFYCQEVNKQVPVPNLGSDFVTGVQGFGHVAVIVPDSETEGDFLICVFGAALDRHDLSRERGDGSRRTTKFYRVGPRHHSLVCFYEAGLQGLQHVLLEYADIDDVGRAFDRSQRQGLTITRSLGRHSTDKMISFYVHTPAGFDIECGWGGLQISEDTWTVTRSYSSDDTWGHVRSDLPDEMKAQRAVESAPHGGSATG